MSYAARIARSIAPYEPSDRPALRAFQREHFGTNARQSDDDHFAWLFERNPHFSPGETALWLCKRDGVIVGQQARLPVVLKAGDGEYRAWWGVDLLIDPEWRLKGVGPALFSAYERSAEILLGLGLSEAAYRMCLRSGWSDLGMLPLMARPLDAGACAEALGSRKWLARLAPKMLVKGSAHAAGAAVRRFRGGSLDLIPSFDERVDAVWALASHDYPVLVKRDFRSLRWRFDEVPGAERYERYYIRCRGQLRGYAVIRWDQWRGHKVAHLLDYLCPRASRTSLLALVIDAVAERNAVALFIEQLSAGENVGILPFGCFQAGAANRFMVKAGGSSSALSSVLCDVSSWFVSRADSDSELPSADPASAEAKDASGEAPNSQNLSLNTTSRAV